MPAPVKTSPAEANVRKVPCPACGALPGRRCRTPGGSQPSVSHFGRREAAITAGYHTP